jgi:hypothetical protein
MYDTDSNPECNTTAAYCPQQAICIGCPHMPGTCVPLAFLRRTPIAFNPHPPPSNGPAHAPWTKKWCTEMLHRSRPAQVVGNKDVHGQPFHSKGFDWIRFQLDTVVMEGTWVLPYRFFWLLAVRQRSVS